MSQHTVKAASDERSSREIAEDLLPSNALGRLADFAAGLPSSRYRQGKAQAIADALGYETPFELRRPLVSSLLSTGTGAGLGGLAGGGIGALLGNAGVGAGLGALTGGSLGALLAGIKRVGQTGQIRNTLMHHLENKDPVNPQRPEIGTFFGSGSTDAGKVDAYLALKNKEKIKPKTISGSLASDLTALATPGGLGPIASSLGNRLYAASRLSADDNSAEKKPFESSLLRKKTASVLRNLAVKRASELLVDSFITKVASAFPITKRAAFRTMQTQLATGDSLPDAIKVAFPKLDATQRHKLAISICKCAVDDANKMTQRSPESYTVPAKDAAKTMREKCSRLGGDGRDEKPLLGQTEKPVLKDPPEARQRMLGDKMESAVSPFLLNYKKHPDLARSAPVSESLPTSAPSPTNAFGFNYMDYLKNPYVLGGLSLGAGGLGAYGLYNLMKKRRRRPVEELD